MAESNKFQMKADLTDFFFMLGAGIAGLCVLTGMGQCSKAMDEGRAKVLHEENVSKQIQK